MSLVYLIVAFETFLKEILIATFEKKTDILASSQKSLTLAELLNCDDIESAKQKLFSEVASEVISRPIGKTVEYFKQNLGIDISDYVDWERFFERFSRRNALVHSEGIADKSYKRETRYSGKKINLNVSDSYLNETIALFKTVAYKLSIDLENKFYA
jgi:hypothetical protein